MIDHGKRNPHLSSLSVCLWPPLSYSLIFSFSDKHFFTSASVYKYLLFSLIPTKIFQWIPTSFSTLQASTQFIINLRRMMASSISASASELCNLKSYQPSQHVVGMEGYGDFMEWPQANLQLKNPGRGFPGLIQDDGDEEAEGIQSKERWAYVKVNMDGVIVGRKICVLDHEGYSSMAHKLEEMFGMIPGRKFCIWAKIIPGWIRIFTVLQGQGGELEACW
ncbi:hypothetical protein Patl1_15095 [Pistacia atlantica]|uniref:Uncharacterized protein n=1 Tax=Pistacia atlantica TaxID=434234 RepID=A0ACC1B9Y8_9ROSI|nr:hypothetical protein Patl1_15095 [Pistacia atlantica]